MIRLNDGLFVHLKGAPDESEIRSLDGSVEIPVPAAFADDLAAVAQGIPDDAPEAQTQGQLIDELIARGLASRGLPAVDPLVEARLLSLGQGFAWTLPDDDRAQPLVSLLRRAHARRKLFVHDFGQTPCLPESGAARCLALAMTLGPDEKRVFLIGDDDLLSLGLSFLGYDVCAIDIDPLVIAFSQQVAKDEGLTLDARVYDVLAPLDDELRGAYDVCLTDPMSYEKCQIAFLSRALAVVKVGGRVLSCVHPIAREIFARVRKTLPVVVENYRYHFSAYTYYDYAENTYRSDLVTMRRVDGALPHHEDDQIPFSHITEGNLSAGFHGLGDVFGMKIGVKKSITVDDVAVIVMNAGHRLTSHAVHESARKLTVLFATEEGGHVLVIVDKARARIAMDVWPYDDRRDGPLLALLGPLVRGVRTSLWYTDAPILPAPIVTF